MSEFIDNVIENETKIQENDDWYKAPVEGDPTTKQGAIDYWSFSPTSGLFATLSATYNGKDDQKFDLSIEHSNTYGDDTLVIKDQKYGRVVFGGEIFESGYYSDGDDYDCKVVDITVDRGEQGRYKLTLDLNEGGNDFYIEKVSADGQDLS